jgi:hypothetical protein
MTMPVDKATRASLRTYALARCSYNGDISIGSKVLVALINGLDAAERHERELREAVEQAQPVVCAHLCATVWKTGTERPHDRLCVALRAVLGE